jgi:sugar transferase (PEP-CTERM system associated)
MLLPMIDRSPVKTRILVLGTGRTALKIGKLRRAADRRGFEVVGYVDYGGPNRPLTAADNSLLRPIIPADAAADFVGMDEVVVALDERRGTLPTEMLLAIKSRGIPVTGILTFLERETGRIDPDLLSPGWFVYTEVGFTDVIYRGIKRLTDILLSSLIFALTVPIFLAVTLMICIEDGFPAGVFYRQSRVGLGGREFRVLKFRSMTINAESESGPLWSVKDDDRVTLVGKLIRRFRIDELPQLFNVIKGEMSIVGPRPERPEFVDLLADKVPMFNVRHSVRPGLTGWAQLNFPYGASVTDAREKLSYDLYYIKNASPVLDMLVFLQTIEVVIWGKAVSMAGSISANEEPPKLDEIKTPTPVIAKLEPHSHKKSA